MSKLQTRSRRRFSWLKIVNDLAARCGCPPELIEKVNVDLPRLRIPELILYPKEFDFPCAEKPNRHYIEASIDLNRNEAPFPWERLEDNKPILYCALGTMRCLSREGYYTFFQSLIRVSARFPQYQLVLATGKRVDIADFHSIPANAIIVNYAPQLKILERAAIMINHGGANTVKECIYFGVPMIIFPLGFDNPGMAARVVHHGLGLIGGNIRKATDKHIHSLLAAIDTNPKFKAQADMMKNKFREREDSRIGIKTIESILGQRCGVKRALKQGG